VSRSTVERPRAVARRPSPPRRRHRLRRSFLGIVGLVVVLVAVSVIGASRTPGNENLKAKWADWLRGHHAAVLVNHLESFYYSHQAPKKGGQPTALNAVPKPQPDPVAGPPVTSPRPGSNPAAPTHLPAPASVPLVVLPGLLNEGQWVAAGPLAGSNPAMFVSQFRADQTYTSQITSAVWIDTSLLKVSLVPGATEPGGVWPETPNISGPALTTAVAAFNGGFRFQDAHGGFYLDGRQAVPLKTGAASLVIYASGKVNIGVWGSEVTMTPDVRAVLQNLVPIVDNGQPAAAATYDDHRLWGATLGANTVVARSGVGVTASGALVYVAGPALTARSLAESLQRVGAVRAMTLDINPYWVTFNFFQHDAAGVSPSKLYPQMQRPATRYLGPTRESRDFFMISLPAA
jgi:hypothetical protein